MVSLYELSVPVCQKSLEAQKKILKMGQDHFAAKGTDFATILNAKIHEDMLALSWQVFIAANVVRKFIGRLTGRTDIPDLERKELSIDECYQVLDDTLKFLSEVKPEQVNGKEADRTECQMGPKKAELSCLQYVQSWTLPNLAFHLDAVYMILRGQGVPLGKADYLDKFFEGIPFTEA